MKKAVAYLEPFLEAEKEELAATGIVSEQGKGKVLMATVKGDVHDIGKNIVGVVLGCNSYEVIDLGVMVPPEKILEEAKKHQVDVIGLSGLITPSLDEMVHVAAELEKHDFNIPLLIGGATTSKAHTAVKIAPEYTKGATLYVTDASRAVTVVERLLSDQKEAYYANILEDYANVRERHLAKQAENTYLSFEEASAIAFKPAWNDYTAPVPKEPGLQVTELALRDLRPYIDWTPFFQTWELHGKFPRILEDKVVGEEATRLFKDANEMLDRIISEKWLKAKAVVRIERAYSTGNDVVAQGDDGNTTFCFLRQQNPSKKGNANRSLADFIAPEESGKQDFIGGFAVTAGLGIEEHISRFEANHQDYESIMLKALADRLAEAGAEYLHQRVRTKIWGYADEGDLTNEDLIREKYVGIRPAPGYPACPDHTEKTKLFEWLKATELSGIELTSGMAMTPTASVSGWYFAHPDSRYFNVGKLTKDQVTHYAKRKNMSLEEAEKWLAPNLAY